MAKTDKIGAGIVMVLVAVKCPFCGSNDVKKYGKNAKDPTFLNLDKKI